MEAKEQNQEVVEEVLEDNEIKELDPMFLIKVGGGRVIYRVE